MIKSNESVVLSTMVLTVAETWGLDQSKYQVIVVVDPMLQIIKPSASSLPITLTLAALLPRERETREIIKIISIEVTLLEV